jgi:hypothetical protein
VIVQGFDPTDLIFNSVIIVPLCHVFNRAIWIYDHGEPANGRIVKLMGDGAIVEFGTQFVWRVTRRQADFYEVT